MTEFHKLTTDIRARLDAIESNLAWLIKAEQRFRVGQRVEFSRKGRRVMIAPKTRLDRKGTVKRIDGFSIVVQLDGYSSPRTFHHVFFNPVRGQKLF